MIMLMIFFVIYAKDINRDINLNEVVQDSILQFDYKVYRLKVSDRDQFHHKALVLNLFSQNKSLKVYVDCSQNFQIFINGNPPLCNQQLKISYQQRINGNCSDNQFFITVLSDSISSYELILFIFDGIHSLEYNVPFNGILIPQEIHQFKVEPSYLNEEITIEITLEKAQSFIKKCSQKDCLITKLDQEGTQNRILLEKDSFRLTNSNCENCYYLIGLLSDYKQYYRIILINIHSHIILKEGHYDQYQVDQGYSIYYSYQISNLTDIKKSKFFLTQITGRCMLYGSSQNMYPSQTNYEQQEEYQIIINNTKEYFLTVFGISQCKYRINTQVEREQTIDLTLFNQLRNGISVLHKQIEQYSFFIIQLEIQANFSIKLQSHVGDFMMYVKSNISDNEIPDSNSFQWKDTKQIDIKIDNINQAKYYYISVQLLNSEGEFLIEYNLDVEIKFYEVNNQIIDSVNENEIKYYKIPMLYRDLLFIKELYTENLISDLRIYVSLFQSNTFPNELSNDYVFLDKSLIIQQEQQICNKNFNQNQTQCFIYLSVTSTNGLVFYTIIIQQLNNKIKLYEGIPLNFSFQEKVLFYYILNEKEVTIQWYSQGGSEADLLAYLGYLNDSSIQYQQFKSSKSQINHLIQTIIIPENNQGYILYIMVSPSLKHFENDVYSIGVYETVKILTKQDTMRDYIQKGQIKFYMLALNEDTISIIFNIQVIGSQDFIFVLLQQSEKSRPHIINDSIQQSLRFDSFYIFRNYYSRFFEKDYYVLGVQGVEDCEFQLSYQLQDTYFQFFPNGYIPQEIFQESIPTVYLFIEKESFQIILAVFTGAVQIRAKRFYNKIDSLDFADSFILDDITREFKLYEIDTCLYERCQYLIQIIKIEEGTQGKVQIKKNQQIIELFENTAQFEILQKDEIVVYNYNSKYNFFIILENVFGQIQIDVQEQNKPSDYNQNSQNIYIVDNNTIIDYVKATQKIEKFIIKIQCLSSNAVFQITMRRKYKKISKLLLGQTIDIQLIRQEQILFQYQSLRNLINNSNTTKFLTLQIIGIYESIDILDILIQHSITNPIIHSQKQFQRGIYFKLYDLFGMYNLMITPIKNSSYIRILLTDEDNNILMNGIPQYQLTRVGQPNFYQVSILQNSTLLLEVLTCKGSILIQGTSNPFNLNKQIFEIQIMNKPSQYFNSILQLEKGTYYFLVKLISSSVEDENQHRISYYYIRQQIFEKSAPISFNSFQFRSLNLNWEIAKNELILEIPNLIYDNQLIELSSISIYFIIQICEQDEIFCFYEQYTVEEQKETQFVIIVNQSSQENNTKINLDIQNKQKIQINIIGKVEIVLGYDLQELTYPFPIRELNIQDIQEQQGKYQQGYGIIILMISIFLIYIVCGKRRNEVKSKVAKTQIIEMNYQTFDIK
ncbi:unnamed protein product [Paramecium sonneborni]|uniref:Transmembrane protein n=1 Tax=Paramecium sonneborni TaxID=65129 RepID=A0A8S1NNR6_9CILI|nr:unnamed protein product [Paramecium sonneborni]